MLLRLNFKLHERETFEVSQISIHFGFGFRPLRISCFLRIWPSGRLLGFASTYLKGSGKNVINTSSNFLILTMMTGLFFERTCFIFIPEAKVAFLQAESISGWSLHHPAVLLKCILKSVSFILTNNTFHVRMSDTNLYFHGDNIFHSFASLTCERNYQHS